MDGQAQQSGLEHARVKHVTMRLPDGWGATTQPLAVVLGLPGFEDTKRFIVIRELHALLARGKPTFILQYDSFMRRVRQVAQGRRQELHQNAESSPLFKALRRCGAVSETAWRIVCADLDKVEATLIKVRNRQQHSNPMPSAVNSSSSSRSMPECKSSSFGRHFGSMPGPAPTGSSSADRLVACACGTPALTCIGLLAVLHRWA